MAKYLMALDQGTTSSRCILFEKNGKIHSMAQKEFSQIYPQPGWVEHDPREIWASQLAVTTEAMAKVMTQPENQRETTIIWDRNTGEPIYNAIVWQCRRTAGRIDELVALAVETGREGVKALKAKPVEKAAPAPAAAAPKAAPTPAKPMGPNDYMVIGLARIDDRLIHGQVATRWTKETNVSRIIVVSDEVAADTVRKTLLTQVAPPGVTAHVVDVAKMIRVYNNPKYAGERVMLLFTNPTDVERLVEGGVKITSVNVGGMAFRQGKTQVNNAVSVDEKDIEAFKKLNARGIELEVRKVSTDPKLKMMDLISKIDK